MTHLCIVGAGAMGCYVAHQMASVPDLKVTLVGRQWFVDALSANGGLHVFDGSGSTTNSCVRAAASLEDVPRPELILLTVKGFDTATVADQVKKHYGLDVAICSLQNGIGNEQHLVDMGFRNVFAGSLTTPVSVIDPGVIRIDKPSTAIGLASWSAAGSVEQIATVLAAGRFSPRVYRDASSMKWSKLLLNMLANATSAIVGLGPVESFAHRPIMHIELAALRETLAVMRAANIRPVTIGAYRFGLLAPIARWFPFLVLGPFLRRGVVAGRGGKPPSLLLDVQRKRPETEMAYLNGAIVQVGNDVGVSTPVNAALVSIFDEVKASGIHCDPEMLNRRVVQWGQRSV